MSEPLLAVQLTAGYGKRPILPDVEFSVAHGEKLGLAGTSGAGKSTLVLALMGLLSWRQGWAKGQVLFEGENLLTMREGETRRVRGKRIALVPQSPSSALNGALKLRTHFEQAWKAHSRERASVLTLRLQTLLREVHLPSDDTFLARRPNEISVGQAQRVVIALALLHRPALLIADEPTSALDPCNQIEVLDVLRRANRQDGTALLYISHDLLSILQLCERMAVLDAGRIVESVSLASVEESARHASTLTLLRTLPLPAASVYAYARRSNASAITSGAFDTRCVPQWRLE